MIYIIIIAGLFALDQAIKKHIEEQPDDSLPHTFNRTKGFITIHKSHNPGLMLGFLKGKHDLPKWLPFGTTLAVGAYFICTLFQKDSHAALAKFPLALILGGALSNLADRFHYQYVVDYFSMNIKKIKHIVFNLGDIFIFAGTLLLLICELFRDSKR